MRTEYLIEIVLVKWVRLFVQVFFFFPFWDWKPWVCMRAFGFGFPEQVRAHKGHLGLWLGCLLKPVMLLLWETQLPSLQESLISGPRVPWPLATFALLERCPSFPRPSSLLSSGVGHFPSYPPHSDTCEWKYCPTGHWWEYLRVYHLEQCHVMWWWE